MPYLPRSLLERADRMLVKPAFLAPVPLSRRLLHMLRHLNPPPRDVSIRRHAVGEAQGELAVPDGADPDIRVLYLHGGGYCTGSPAVQRALSAHIAKAAGVAVYSVRYRLAPEYPCPAGIEDAVAAYAALGEASEHGLLVSGDSAGAGLALATAIAARDRDMDPPTGLALISPWIDLAMSGPSYADNARAEAVLSNRFLRRMARDYCAGREPDDPLCSPLYADLAGLPPTLVHNGTNDLLLSDSESLVERMRAAGGEAELRVFAGMWHDFHLHAGAMADAELAVAELGAWISERLGEPA